MIKNNDEAERIVLTTPRKKLKRNAEVTSTNAINMQSISTKIPKSPTYLAP